LISTTIAKVKAGTEPQVIFMSILVIGADQNLLFEDIAYKGLEMKIEVTEDRDICLKEVFSGVLLETQEGNQIGVCMRDDTFEINIMPDGSTKHNWWRVDMKNGIITKS
jgi:hypothetical protein